MDADEVRLCCDSEKTVINRVLSPAPWKGEADFGKSKAWKVGLVCGLANDDDFDDLRR